MRVVTDKHREVVRHFRTIELEDGPTVDVGEGPTASYFPGTLIVADRLKQEWVGDAEPLTVLVSGPYVGGRGDTQTRDRYEIRYRAVDGYPDWIKNIL
jgi:hypothetical protein